MKKLGFTVLIISLHSLVWAQECLQIKSLLEAGSIEKAFDIVVKLGPSPLPACNNLVGQVYLQKGRYDLAEEYFTKALDASGQETEHRATSLGNLGLVYANTGNFERSVDFLKRAYTIREQLFGAKNEQVAASLNDLGVVLASKDPDAALDNYEAALRIYREVYGDLHQKVAQSLLNTALVYIQLEFYGDAVNNLNEALSIWQGLYADGHPNEGIIYNYLAEVSLALGQRAEAMSQYQKALQTYQKHYGDKHPETAFIHSRIGNFYNTDGDFKRALEFYQKALIANSPTFNDETVAHNPAITSFFNANTMLSTLYFKARAYMDKHYVKTRKFNDLKISLQTLYSCDSLIDNMRQFRTNEGDKLELGRSAALVYEMGVALCLGMAEVVAKKGPYYEASLYFAEKSKSAVLLEAISDASAKSFANIPASEIEQEKKLKADITFYERQASAKAGQTETSAKLFELRQEYESFVKSLEERYPGYYNLKYNVSIPSVAQVQSLLDEKTVVLSYFVADEAQRVYCYVISKRGFEVFNDPQGENFDRYINGLRNSLYFKEDEVYKLTGHELYKLLIPKKIPKEVDKIVVIPHGRLGIVPFETLLSASPKNMDYTALSYLVKDYSVSYQYALALHYQRHSAPGPGNEAGKALLCAPVTFDRLPALPGTDQEIRNLQDILTRQGITPEILLEAKASEQRVKTGSLSQYKYIHLATHGVVDEVNPKDSRILLKQDDQEDGFLYSGEIYNLDLDASLVTLSACETGLGRISKGEGIIGLSRALLYAGANNLVVSLWNVADQSTAQLMVDFYQHVGDHQFGTALKTAKLDMIDSEAYAHPYYWAPFILIGQ